ncbi:MAG: sulfite exporter TauE/SafE family protein [Clostridia bacterium]|nr:sulfite exporter TauE/SafE family protein [Clostridia bacterium]
MKTKIIDYAKKAGVGIAVGIVNGMFGAGGGMIAVPLLRSCGLDQKNAHRNAIAVILPITVLSAIIYLFKDYVKLNDAYIFIPTGLIGAYLGSKIIAKISPKILKGIFGGFMIYAGISLLRR